MSTITSTSFPATSARTVDGVTRIDLAFATGTAMGKGSGTIFVTDGAMQTVIDRVTGEPKLRAVGATYTAEIPLDQVSIVNNVVTFKAAGLPAGAAMNVYMGAGTLLGAGKALGAITVPGSASFTVPVPNEPPPPPGLSASIAVEDKTLKAGDDIKVTVSFSKAVSSLDMEAIAAEHASVKHLEHSADMRTWTITLGPDDSIASLSNVLRLDLGKVVADDGTYGSGVVASASYAVDTIVDAYILPYLGINDEGPSDEDGVTNDVDQYLSGVLMGELAADEHIELIVNGREIDKALIHLIGEGSASAWYYDPEDESGATPVFNEGANTVSVRVVKADGHSSGTFTRTVTIDTDAPEIVSRPSAPVDAGQAITIGFDEAMYLSGNVEVVDEIEVVDGFGNTSWIALDDGMFSSDRKTLTIPAAGHNLASGNTYHFHLPYGLTDLAGNEVAGEEITFTTAGPFEDKAAPRLVQAYIVNGSGSYKAGEVLEFRLRYTEKVNLDAGTDPVLYLQGGLEAEYFGLAGDGHEMVFKYTVKPGDNVENLYDVYSDTVLFGHVRDDRGNVFDRAHVEYDGLTIAGGYGAWVEIDTATAAAPGTAQLHANSEATAPGTGTTADTQPRLTGSGAEAYATIAIYAGGVKVGTTIADENGRWDKVLGSALSSGSHQITVTQEDRAGNVSTASTAFSLTITSPAPVSLGTPALDPASDTGVSDSDSITLADQPTIGGTGPADTALKLKHNGTEIATVTTDASGKWSYTLPSLEDGVHSFTVQQGETGPSSAALAITVDGANPSVGSAWDGPVSNVNPNGDLVITFSEAIHIAAAEDDSDMVWILDPDNNAQKIALSAAKLSADQRTLTISAADHNLQALTSYRVQLPATLTDLAGNGIGEYEIRFTTGNDALPGAVRATVFGDGNYRAGETVVIRVRFNEQVEKWGETGLSLGLSNNARATFSGMSTSGEDALFSYTVAPGEDTANLTISDTSQLARRFVDLSGNMLDNAHITLADLHDGYGSRIEVSIDTAAAAPGLAAFALATNDTTPALAGTAEAYARVELYKGTTLLGYGYANGSGNWSVSVDADKALAEGTHQVTVRQVDRAGNASAATAPVNLTVDTTVLAPGAPRLASGYDTGASTTDNLTRENRPVFAGSGAEANAIIKIMVGDSVLGSAIADASGNWQGGLSTETGILLNGAYAFTVKQEDAAGNLSAASSALVITVDRAAPAAPSKPVLAAGSDTGVSNSDGLTSNRTPTFTGTGAEANAEVVLYADEVEVGRAFASASGAWSIGVASGKLVTDRSHSIAVKQFDAAGNASGYSDSFNLILDTTAPASALDAPDLHEDSDSGSSRTDNITNDSTPTFTGSGALAGGEVALIVGSSEVGRATADASGNWSITSSTLADGVHQVRVRQFDLAGNAAPDSEPLSVTIDTLAPTASVGTLNLATRKFLLPFSETIVFTPSGQFKLYQGLIERLSYWGNNSSSWSVTADSDGDMSVLNFNISLEGLLKLQWTNGSVTDLAGNLAVITGTPEWEFSVPYSS